MKHIQTNYETQTNPQRNTYKQTNYETQTNPQWNTLHTNKLIVIWNTNNPTMKHIQMKHQVCLGDVMCNWSSYISPSLYPFYPPCHFCSICKLLGLRGSNKDRVWTHHQLHILPALRVSQCHVYRVWIRQLLYKDIRLDILTTKTIWPQHPMILHQKNAFSWRTRTRTWTWRQRKLIESSPKSFTKESSFLLHSKARCSTFTMCIATIASKIQGTR